MWVRSDRRGKVRFRVNYHRFQLGAKGAHHNFSWSPIKDQRGTRTGQHLLYIPPMRKKPMGRHGTNDVAVPGYVAFIEKKRGDIKTCPRASSDIKGVKKKVPRGGLPVHLKKKRLMRCSVLHVPLSQHVIKENGRKGESGEWRAEGRAKTSSNSLPRRRNGRNSSAATTKGARHRDEVNSPGGGREATIT